MKLWYNTTQPGFGAVGSARALGAGGHQFESDNPDHFLCPILLVAASPQTNRLGRYRNI